jgi:hypothetical protein
MSSDDAVRKAAIHRLAIATKELLPENKQDRDAWFRVYLDGLSPFHTQTVIDVCRRLETTAEGGWFPKLPELCEACRAYVRMKTSLARPTYQLDGPPVSPERIAALKDEVARRLERMRMRNVEED